MANKDLKLYAAGRGVRQWELADKLGMREESLSRKMRKEVEPDFAERFKQAVDEIVAEQKGVN